MLNFAKNKKMTTTILIIDDEEKLRTLLSRIIHLEGFEVVEANNAKNALKKLENNENINIILCDVKLPDQSGIDLVKEIKAKYPSIEIIVLTAYGNIADGVLAIQNGAFNYITKGDDNHKIIPLIQKAQEKIQQNTSSFIFQSRSKNSFQHIIGTSKSILDAIHLAKKVAQTSASVLLLGETGTGKEVFAQAIHEESPRHKHKLMAINCATFSKELLESELFGHKAGAFTGAIQDKKGLFEEANQGTIFLDEIGEMPFNLQAKLLRVLENGEFIKIGETKITKVDVRIIAATNRNIENDIKNNQFREDLFYRLSVFQIILPPLRERKEDIELLMNYFIAFFAKKTNKNIPEIENNFIDALKNYTWNGNIRELKNTIERCMILMEENLLSLQYLPYQLQNNCITDNYNNMIFDLSSLEKIHIQKVLKYTNNNKTETAVLLNIGLTTLYRKIEEYKIKVK